MAIPTRNLMPLLAVCLAPAAGLAAVERHTFATDSAYLVVEILSDDLVHFEAAAGFAPPLDQPLYTSPMVLETDYDGPSSFHRDGATLKTPGVRVQVNPGNLCVEVRDKARDDTYLTTFCPMAFDSVDSPKGLDIDPGAITHVYGLGHQFQRPGSADGDWLELGDREAPRRPVRRSDPAGVDGRRV